MRFREKNSAVWKYIALLRANQIARITCDFKMDVINYKTSRTAEINLTLFRNHEMALKALLINEEYQVT